jgi:hypothetical protein
LLRIAEVVEALNEIGQLVKLDAHGVGCSCSDGHCPGFDLPQASRQARTKCWQVYYEIK